MKNDKKILFFISLVLSFLFTTSIASNVKPCSGKDCPLPPNFDEIISCCSNSVTDRQKFIEVFQRKEAARQNLAILLDEMKAKKLISPKTQQLEENFMVWEMQATNKPIKDWPSRHEINARLEVVLSSINHDRKTVFWYRLLCKFSNKYCW